MGDVDLDAIGSEAETRLSELLVRRSLLSLDALSGDDGAARDLGEVEDEIAELTRRIALCDTARSERERLQAERAELAEQERRERAQLEAERLAAQRDGSLRDVQAELLELAAKVEAFLHLDADLQDASVHAGHRHKYRSLRETAAELAVIALRDAGLGEPLPFVRASVSASLRAAYPPPARTSVPAGEPSSRCRVCQHPQRDTLLAALAGGASYREVAASFGVSKSALSRHTAHSS